MLGAVRRDLGAAWVGVGMAGLLGDAFSGVWLARDGDFPPFLELETAELLRDDARTATLCLHATPVEQPVASCDVWLYPLPLRTGPGHLRRSTVLVVPARLPDPTPQSVTQLGVALGDYERSYVADVLLSAIEQAPDPVELTDRRARLLYVNRAWRQYFDYEDGAALGLSPGELVRDAAQPVHDASYVQFSWSELRKRREWLGTMGSRNRHGERRFNEAHVSSFKGPLANYEGNVAIRRDLTQRASRDAALASAHREFRSVLAAMPDAVVVLRDDVIYFANRAFTDLLERQPEEVIGEPFSRYVHAEDRATLLNWSAASNVNTGPNANPPPYASAAAPEGEPHRGDAGKMRSVRLTQTSGHLRVVEVSMAGNVSFEGFPSHILVARDVTERMFSREQLARTERLAALGALAVGVAHEVNNPLAYVLLNLEAAREHASAGAHEALDEALDGARRIGEIVAELRGFWNSSDDALGAVDVATAVASAVNLAQSQLRHRASLERDLEPDLLVFARHGQLVQILLNLLVNDSRARPEDDIRPHTIRISSRGLSTTRAEITVSDTGVGLSPGTSEDPFEPSTSIRPGGIGPTFGLAISKRMIEELGGSIQLTERGPGGTTFAVQLPRLVKEEAMPESRNSQPDLLQAPYRVLVVDDEPLIARAIKRALDPFVVQVAGDGAEAMAALESGPDFDVILCDLMMPRVTGADLFQQVQQRFPRLTNRFVFMTGGAFADWSQRFLEEAKRPIIEKPFQPSQLRRSIEAVARRARR